MCMKFALTLSHRLQVLMSIAAICDAEARVLLKATQAAADEIKEALTAARSQQQEDESEDEEGTHGSRIDAVKAYFQKHHSRTADGAVECDAETKVDPGRLACHSVFAHYLPLLAHAFITGSS